MDKITKIICLTIILIFFNGCTSIDSDHISKDETAKIISTARQLTKSQIKLTDEEIEFIDKNNPEFSYYFLSGPKYAQYFITWKLNSNNTISISGAGNIHTLENSKIEKY